MEKSAIIDGPSKADIIMAFANRDSVTFKTDGMNYVVIITSLEYEDGGIKSFNFKTERGGSGYYHTQKRKGWYISTL